MQINLMLYHHKTSYNYTYYFISGDTIKDLIKRICIENQLDYNEWNQQFQVFEKTYKRNFDTILNPSFHYIVIVPEKGFFLFFFHFKKKY
jgi:hypothetical protein